MEKWQKIGKEREKGEITERLPRAFNFLLPGSTRFKTSPIPPIPLLLSLYFDYQRIKPLQRRDKQVKKVSSAVPSSWIFVQFILRRFDFSSTHTDLPLGLRGCRIK